MKNILTLFLAIFLIGALVFGYSQYSQNQLLKNELKELKLKNNNLEKKLDTIYTKLESQHQKDAKKLYERSLKKIDNAFEEAVPVAGVVDIVNDVKQDVEFYCSYLKEQSKLKNNLFDKNSTQVSLYEKNLCSLNVENELRPLLSQEDVKEYQNLKKSSLQTIELLKKKYENSKKDAKEVLETLEKKYNKITNDKDLKNVLHKLQNDYKEFSKSLEECFINNNESNSEK
jgi:hypothetical protein